MPTSTWAAAQTPMGACRLYATAVGTLRNWPYTLYALLQSFIPRTDELAVVDQPHVPADGLLQAWGALGWSAPVYAPVQAALDAFLLDNWLVSRAVATARYREDATFRTVACGRAMTMATAYVNASPEVLDYLLHLGVFTEADLHTPSVMAGLRIRPEDVSAYTDRHNPTMTYAAAAEWLGLTTAQVHDLVAENLLRCAHRQPMHGSNDAVATADHLLLHRASVEALVTHVLACAATQGLQRGEPRDLRLMRLAEAAQALEEVGVSLTLLLQLMVMGELRTFWAHPWIPVEFSSDLSRLRLEALAIERWVVAVRRQRDLNDVLSVARSLGTAPEALEHWHALGLLVPDAIQAGMAYYTTETVAAFRACYVPVHRAHRQLHVHWRTIHAWIANGLLPVVPGTESNDAPAGRGPYTLIAAAHIRTLRARRPMTLQAAAAELGITITQVHTLIRTGQLSLLAGPVVGEHCGLWVAGDDIAALAHKSPPIPARTGQRC